MPSPASATQTPGPTLDALWPTGAQAGLLVLRPNVWADTIDAVDARFGDVPAVRSLATRLRSEAFFGHRIGGRDWGPGLDFDRGLALFKVADGLRLVVGLRDASTAESSLRALHLLEMLEEDGKKATCAADGDFLICESGQIGGRSGPPSGAAAPAGALAWFWAGGGLEGLNAPGAKVREATGWITQDGERFNVGMRGDFEFDSAAKGMPLSPESLWAVFTPQRPAPEKPSFISPEAGGALKLDFDFPRLMALARQAGAHVEPAFAPAVAQLESAFTGELTITFDGGLSHPVLLLGVSKGAPGDAALPGLVSLIGALGARANVGPCADAPGQICLEIAVETPAPGQEARLPGIPELKPAGMAPASETYGAFVTLHSVRVGDTLVIATTAPDAARRAAPGFVSAPWPPSLRGSGASGLTAPGFAGLAGLMGAAPFLRFSQNVQWFLDAEILSSLVGATVEGIDLSFRAAPQHASFELTWRTM